MKLKITSLTLFFFFSLIQITSSEEVSNLIFNPLIANIYESRIGAVFTNSDKKMRLDIGGNYDFWKSQINNNSQISTGAEFFTYTRLRSDGNFKFPVETTDFYFGLNANYKNQFENFILESRFRIAHISTHLSDGFSNNSQFFKAPFVYSREFIDWTFAARKGSFRPYLGAIINFSYLPKDLNVLIPQAGIEFNCNVINNIYFVSGYDFKLNGYDNKYIGMNTLVAGFEFRTAENRGILLKAEYFSGMDYYGQFYKNQLSYFGVGFELKYH